MSTFWTDIWNQFKGIVIGSVGTAAVGGICWWIAESRRRLNFIAKDVYFGPTLSFNPFMARNYPLEDAVSFECEIQFFSNKTQQTGLHNFRVEFCRTSYIGPIVEFTASGDDLHRDLMKRDGPNSLETLELPPRQFVRFSLETMFEREKWPALRGCDVARLSCETPEGRTKRFTLGRIRFPAMPAEGIRGIEFMSVEIVPHGRDFIIRARRRYDGETSVTRNPLPQDARFWTGSGWGENLNQAKIYVDVDAARSDGEKPKIWNIVPTEWQEKVRR